MVFARVADTVDFPISAGYKFIPRAAENLGSTNWLAVAGLNVVYFTVFSDVALWSPPGTLGRIWNCY